MVLIETPSATRVLERPYRDQLDWWAIRGLLVDAHAQSMPGWDWDVRRWDGWRYHREHPLNDADLGSRIRLWETLDGRLVGAVHADAVGDAVMELHPAHRDLETAMLGWAEDHLAVGPDPDGRRGLTWWVLDADEERRRLLSERGYVAASAGASLRQLSFATARPAATLVTEAHRLRMTETTTEDCQRMADLLNAAFGRTTHTAREYRTFVERSPSFEHDLNLVAVASDGSFAAHVGATFDACNRHAIIEPVCTHPHHRRAGLARALILEALHRLRARGARTAQVDTGDDAAPNALYAACGFTEVHHLRPWHRSF
jgi:GNAT superfamily N-acetyltransferase